LTICADEENINRIFNVLYKLGTDTTGALLSLLALKNYTYRYIVYKILGDIGAKQSIEMLKATSPNEDIYFAQLTEALNKLNKKYF
jgi:hypothetical protein